MNVPSNVDSRFKNSRSLRKSQLRSMAISILQLECFVDKNTNDDKNNAAMKMSPSARQVLRRARIWSDETIAQKK
jgi:hypothetical protein